MEAVSDDLGRFASKRGIDGQTLVFTNANIGCDTLSCLRIAVFQSVNIPFQSFPEERKLFMKWIVAIQRHIGKHFQLTTHTRVCSRHFKPSDHLPSLAGRKRP